MLAGLSLIREDILMMAGETTQPCLLTYSLSGILHSYGGTRTPI